MRYAVRCSALPRRITRGEMARAQPSGSLQATSTSAGSPPRSRSRIAPPTMNASPGSLASAGKSARRSSRNGIAQHADAFDLDFDAIARVERPDARRRAGEDHIARLERHHRGDELEQHVAGEDHVARVAILADLAVPARGHRQRGDVELGLDAGTEGREGVERLAARELDVFFLQVDRKSVV